MICWLGFLVVEASTFNNDRSQKQVLLSSAALFKEEVIIPDGKNPEYKCKKERESKKEKAIDYDYSTICVSIS